MPILATILAAWQDACDLILLTDKGSTIRLHCRERRYIADKLNRPVKIRPDLGLVFEV